jgi:hypothetical protein
MVQSLLGGINSNMMIKKKYADKVTGKTFILCLMAWFIIASLLYVFVHLWESSRRRDLVRIGVAISKDISSQSGLPLLERKIDHLGQLIQNITKKPEVVFASIIDHKNKLIAYTDQDQFFTLSRKKSNELEGVHYWRISNLNHQKVMNFSSEITFSGTRVGEVFISLAAENMGMLKQSFFWFAALSLTALIVFFCYVRYRDLLAWWNTKYKQLNPPAQSLLDQNGEGDFSCPLCSSTRQFSQDSFRMKDLDESFLLIKACSQTNKDVFLGDLARDKELRWLKNSMIAQCGKIITKLSTE